jgi:hypothetical protein
MMKRPQKNIRAACALRPSPGTITSAMGNNKKSLQRAFPKEENDEAKAK